METYRFTGSKVQGDNTQRIILEGSTSDPKRFIDRGNSGEMTEEEVKEYRAMGFNFTKLNEEQVATEQEKAESGADTKRGADQAGTSLNPSGLSGAGTGKATTTKSDATKA